MNIPTPEDILVIEHKDWLCHPVTKQLVKNIEVWEKHILNKLYNTVFTDASNDLVRAYTASLNNTESIKKFITDTEAFLKVALNKIK